MPVHLEAPSHRPGGPDGQGWNRLSLNAHMGGVSDQCALRPRSYATLYESQSTTRARWGGFGRCTGSGDCTQCPRLEALEDPKYLPASTPRVLVRLRQAEPTGGNLLVNLPPPQPYVVDQPELGWASPRYRWTWENLVRLRGWRLAGTHVDEHGEGFWLEKLNPALLHGIDKTDL